MKYRKIIYSILMILFVSLFFLPASAEKEYLEAKDYLNTTTDVAAFLKTCKSQGKDAYFNSGVYKIPFEVELQDGVSILGEPGTVFQGADPENLSYLIDSGTKVSSITVKNIIFDNVKLHFQNSNSDNITIQNNIFMNAKTADTSIGGIAPVNGKNGGPNTGYYISKSYKKITILSNLFLRDQNSLGRGISIYKTKDALIQDNFFGLLEDVENSIVSNETKALKQLALDSGLLDTTSNQGYFMTAINVVNSDENAQILGNYFSLNRDITEAGYEDGSQSTGGYNRDHIIYAKLFINLNIVGNYFKGMNKNQDGAVKCRNGEGLLIYRNVFEDSLILLYIQAGTPNDYLKDVLIQENIFLNKDYWKDKTISIPSGDKTLTKYYTIDYLILLMNYVVDGEINNITYDSNKIYSVGLKNEQFRIDNNNCNMPTNLTIENNTNAIGGSAKVTIMRTSNTNDYDSNANYTNGTKYMPEIPEEYQNISVESLVQINEVEYEIVNNKIETSANKVYLDGVLYNNQALEEGRTYDLFLIKSSTTDIVVEGKVTTIPSNLYTACSLQINVTHTITYNANGHGTTPSSIKADSIPMTLPYLTEKGYTFDGWYLDANCTQPVSLGTAITKDTTLYAKWNLNVYNITYVTAHGTTPDAVEGTSIPNELPVLSETKFKFVGWYLDYAFENPAVSGTKITANTILCAKWITLYEVSFSSNQQVTKDYLELGSKVTKPEDPVRPGYTFGGWYKEKDYKTLWDFDQDVVEQDVTLYAKWTITTYTVQYESCGHGTKLESTTVFGTLPNPLPKLTESGWEFEGWYLDAEYNTVATAGATIDANVVLYAKWGEVQAPTPATYNITFNMHDHGTAPTSVAPSDKLPNPLPSVADVEGWHFVGWYLDAEYTTVATAGAAIDANAVLHAKWEAVQGETPTPTPETYTITYNVLGHGEAPASATGTALPNTLPVLTADGYTFGGWFLDAACTQAATPGASISADTTLYAKWIRIIVFTVTYTIQGQGPLATIKVVQGEHLARPEDPVKKGATFSGWYKDKDCTQLWDFETDVVGSDMTLYAKWTESNSSLLWIWLSVGGIVLLAGITGIVLICRKKKK